ncbi:MAG: thioether cross-link-forming SCIFF peptide maturase [Clostridia bacterium]|nr:thioether cross-link-forming SCIFF peptide maturase [Clostridia bacterium]
MIHLFNQNGYNICLDVNSGAIHVPDDIAYKILEKCNNLDEYVKLRDIDEYNMDNKEFRDAYNEIDGLIEEGSLFSDIDIPEKPAVRGIVFKALCLHMAHACNLRCDYCFAGDGEYSGGTKLMPLDVAKKAVDLLLSKSGSKKNVEIDFFGGEPMLNFDVIKKTVEYALSEQAKYGKAVHFTITTNGTILDEGSLEFINENMDNVVISLDGRKEIHDRYRLYPDGRGSYEIAVENAKKIVSGRNGKSYFVRGTFTRNNLDFANDVRHLASFGFRDISIEPVTGGEFGLDEHELGEVLEEYETFSSEYAKQEDYTFYHFNISLYNSPCIYKRLTACGAGFEYGAVTPDGEIFACHRLAGIDEFKLGTVDDDEFDEELANKMKNNNVGNIEKCRGCWAKYFCSGGCPATAYFTNGSISEPDETTCLMQKKRIECAMAIEVERASEDKA